MHSLNKGSDWRWLETNLSSHTLTRLIFGQLNALCTTLWPEHAENGRGSHRPVLKVEFGNPGVEPRRNPLWCTAAFPAVLSAALSKLLQILWILWHCLFTSPFLYSLQEDTWWTQELCRPWTFSQHMHYEFSVSPSHNMWMSWFLQKEQKHDAPSVSPTLLTLNKGSWWERDLGVSRVIQAVITTLVPIRIRESNAKAGFTESDEPKMAYTRYQDHTFNFALFENVHLPCSPNWGWPLRNRRNGWGPGHSFWSSWKRSVRRGKPSP